ncbi:hypothetical protein HMI55_006583 [Coelomomyces lativittatus]|nr:hypothetical protein HMI55_006583 [Coelomomyces lativittatus]
MNQMLTRYQHRNGGYTRILKCGRDPIDQSPLAILEYVDAPGDTMVEIAKLELPKVSDVLQRKSKELEKLKLLEMYELLPRTHTFQTRRLNQSIHHLTKLEKKLTKVLTLPCLPTPYKEEKYPAKDERIKKDKLVWREMLPGLTKSGQPRYVIRKKETLRLEKWTPGLPKQKLVNKHLAL